jgi:hypothetical protein
MEMFSGYNGTALLIILCILALLVILSIAILVRNSRENKRKDEILSLISESVTEINDKVGSGNLAVIKTDHEASETEPELRVIYIDDRTEDGDGIEPIFIERAEVDIYDKRISKFTGRECDVDRNGRKYTLEELRKIIK